MGIINSKTGLSIDDVKQALQSEQKTNEILGIVKGLQNKLDAQHKLLGNIALTVSKLHHEGKMNEETFTKLDEFLRNYYENPYDNDH